VSDVRVVKQGPDSGLYINGIKVPGVLQVEPNLFGKDSIAVVRITLAVDKFSLDTVAPRP
jgi:hypothetical protein